jgi:hypothetical protein
MEEILAGLDEGRDIIAEEEREEEAAGRANRHAT